MRFSCSVLLAALALLGCDDDDPTGNDGPRTYDITVANLTSGQPFSPGVIVTHSSQAAVFGVGQAASEGVRKIAEDGDPSIAMQMLPAQPGVDQVVMIDMPIHRAGGPGPTSRTYRITARAGVDRLSVVTMLICTNDGFTGPSGIELPAGFEPTIVESRSFDSGTEMNNELFDHIVDPCQMAGPVSAPADGNARVATTGNIANHAGLELGGDLEMAHRWQEPVARVTIQRVQQ